MALHPQFPTSPYAPLLPEQRWFPADETLRATAYEKLLPPLVAKIRAEVCAWRSKGYLRQRHNDPCAGDGWLTPE
jgi:type III restriction enzyme